MRHIQTDILVIGGGATGTGVLRDLAMRGFKCTLIERRDLAYGTTGRYHGLLHSGGRYVVNDPQAASECYRENQILRRIMPQCIEDTGGFFVLTPHDDPAYVPQFLQGCRKAGIPFEELPIPKMLKEEPALDPRIRQCFRVPDGSADSFLAAQLNVNSARQHGAQVLVYHEVQRLLVSHRNGSTNSVVKGAICRDLINDEDVQIDADLAINASGAWAGKIAQTAGININMVLGKGTMLALNHRVVNTVINRCRMPSDGDGLVPAHTVTVMGTTDIRVPEPDHYSIEPWEIQLLLDEGEKLIPVFKQCRILRAWAGVRPLVQEASSSEDRDISRVFVLLDHGQRDGVEGILTIISGKWTTYRKMAQVTVDKACEKLHVNRPCQTHLETLPTLNEDEAKYHYLGSRLEKIEAKAGYGQLVCECELVSEDMVKQAIMQSGAATLDDIRRETRLGMGPCQGAFCSFRATGMLHTLTRPPVRQANVALRDFLQERWKGNLPILSEQQLRQARFNELIYVDVLNSPNLIGGRPSILAADNYANPDEVKAEIPHPVDTRVTHYPPSAQKYQHDVAVIGAGLSGLVAAWQASQKGLSTRLITKGWGAPYWTTGCIDIFGYQPTEYNQMVVSPRDYLEKYTRSHPEHPYAIAGLHALDRAVESFLKLCIASAYAYQGSVNENVLLPTALGTLHPTCLVPDTMIAGDITLRTPMLIVGFNGFHDFYPSLVADNLSAQGHLAHDLTLDLRSLEQHKYITGMELARLFDDPEFRNELIIALKPKLMGSTGRIGFPAVLGLRNPIQVLEHLQSSLGTPVFEIPGLPPSIPGIRLLNLLVSNIEQNNGVVFNGLTVSGISCDGNLIHSVWSDTSARQMPHGARNFILATGGILGGGITVIRNDYAQETIFGLPVNLPKPRPQWFQSEFLAPKGHPIFRAGIPVDASFHPVDEMGQIIYQNLFAAGNTLAHCDPIRERSLEGICLVTGFKVGEIIMEGQ